jgi:Ni,Fe-hydrogenase III large subunit
MPYYTSSQLPSQTQEDIGVMRAVLTELTRINSQQAQLLNILNKQVEYQTKLTRVLTIILTCIMALLTSLQIFMIISNQ